MAAALQGRPRHGRPCARRRCAGAVSRGRRPAGDGPLGQRIRIGPNPAAAWRTIVGVVGDLHQAGPESLPQPELYLPITQDSFGGLYLAVRTQGEPAALASTLRDLVHTIHPQLPVIAVTTMEENLGEHVASRRLLMILLTVFAGIALLLSLIGIYGVMGNVVSHRPTRSASAWRSAHSGARSWEWILRDGARLGVSGLGLGIALALAGSRLLRAVLFGVTPTDAATYAAVVVLMLAVCLVACYLPARRAARVDPLTAIRAEG